MVYSVESECPQGYSPQGRALRLSAERRIASGSWLIRA